MTIYQGSRYESSPVVVLPSDRGWRPGVLRDVPVASDRYLEMVVGENDSLEDIAARLLGDPERWWVIADANPDLLYPAEIPPGYVLRIPYADRLR